MLTSEVLNRAADEIERRGWVGFHRDGESDPWGGGSGAENPVCLEGGIAAAMGIDLGDELDSDSRENAFAALTACPAYRAVSTYLVDKQVPGFSKPYHYNDHPDRTAAEVIEVLRAAAAIEQAREAETTPAPRSVLTSPSLLELAADRHGVPVVVVDGYYSAILWRPSGEAILWRVVVPESERVALGLAVA